jgi:hypothetical protein
MNTIRQALIREMNKIVHNSQERAVGTGLERGACWTNSTPSVSNSANAAQAAKQTANKVRKCLAKIMSDLTLSQDCEAAA